MDCRVAALLAMTRSFVAIATKLIVIARRLAGKPTKRHPGSIGDTRAVIARSAKHDVAIHLERPTDLREAGGWSAASLRSSQ